MRAIRIIITCFLIIFVFSLSYTVQAAEINKYGASSNNNVISQPNNISTELPQKYSSVDNNLVTPVKNQGNSDTCWAYASTSSFESLLLLNNLFISDLSTTHMDKWATPEEDNIGWLRKTGEGGFTYIPCGYYTSWNGAVRESENTVSQGVTSLIYLDKSDRNSIKKTIIQSGAVTANLGIINKAYSKDKSSYCLNKKNPAITGHTLSVVGWDDNYSKENFNGRYSPENNGAWLCKNSWGDKENNIGGYLWVSYEDYYIFDNDIFSPSFGVKSFINLDINNYLYQNEKYGATYEFIYADKESKDIVYLNVFDFSKNGNVLDKVIFETTSVGASYSLYYIPLKDGIPTTDKKYWQQLGQGTVEYSGYICKSIKSVVPQSKGAIAVEIDTSAAQVVNSIGVDEWLTDTNDTFLFIDKCKKGNGYIIYNDTIEDIKDYYENKLQDSIGGNLVIKAVSSGKYDIFYGDTNLDEELSITDATLIQKKLVKMKSFNVYQNANADYNKDGIINVLDVTAIQKKLAKID